MITRAPSQQPLPSWAKGFCGLPAGSTAADLVDDGAHVFDGRFSWPLLTIRDTAVEHNIGQLARFCRDAGVELAPHAKTTMAPQLFARQLAAGAWGLTAATITHVRLYRDFGVGRILLANELVDRAGMIWLAGELRRDEDFELYCYVDSLDGVRLLDESLDGTGRRLPVLIELGHEDGRTGCRSTQTARDVARAAHATSTLQVAGVAGYEGGLGDAGLVRDFCGRLVDLLHALDGDGTVRTRPVLSAGGSAFPDVVADVLGRARDSATVVLRSGAYITHDDGLYADVSPFTATAGSPYALRPALELWTQVLSRPEPGLAVLNAGRRDIGYDQGMPRPGRVRSSTGDMVPATGMQVTRLNDQHAYLAVPTDSAVRAGDLVSLTISHPCTTIDHWQHMLLLDDADRVVDVVHTYF